MSIQIFLSVWSVCFGSTGLSICNNEWSWTWQLSCLMYTCCRASRMQQFCSQFHYAQYPDVNQHLISKGEFVRAARWAGQHCRRRFVTRSLLRHQKRWSFQSRFGPSGIVIHLRWKKAFGYCSADLLFISTSISVLTVICLSDRNNHPTTLGSYTSRLLSKASLPSFDQTPKILRINEGISIVLDKQARDETSIFLPSSTSLCSLLGVGFLSVAEKIVHLRHKDPTCFTVIVLGHPKWSSFPPRSVQPLLPLMPYDPQL